MEHDDPQKSKHAAVCMNVSGMIHVDKATSGARVMINLTSFAMVSQFIILCSKMYDTIRMATFTRMTSLLISRSQVQNPLI